MVGELTGGDRVPRPEPVSSLTDLEARVAAREAAQYDYRAVLAAGNASGTNQREMAETLREHGWRLGSPGLSQR